MPCGQWDHAKDDWPWCRLYLAGAAALLVLLYSMIGIDLFPAADAGYLQLRVKAPIGTRIEQTEELSKQALKLIEDRNWATTPSRCRWDTSAWFLRAIPINSVYLWTSGPEEAVMRVAVRSGLGSMESIKRRLRERFYAELPIWIEKKWIDEGVPSRPGQDAGPTDFVSPSSQQTSSTK